MFEYEGIKINYKDYGKKDGNVIVYLHGWGQNIEMMEPIANPFQDTHRLIILDLPGFGKSEEPKSVWSLEQYADMVHSLLESLGIKKANLIGHSFGGKISIIYASKYEVERMILLASPFEVKIKKPSLKIRILKKLAKIPGIGPIANKIKQKMGSTDYKNATPMMRNILVKLASLTATPVVSIWGATHPYAGFMGFGQPADNAIQLDLDCRPCSIYGQKPCQRGDYACLKNIPPERIVEKIVSIINN